jgi:hypothetical protein
MVGHPMDDLKCPAERRPQGFPGAGGAVRSADLRRQPVGLAAANEQRQDFVYLQADNPIGHRQDPPAEPEVEATG